MKLLVLAGSEGASTKMLLASLAMVITTAAVAQTPRHQPRFPGVPSETAAPTTPDPMIPPASQPSDPAGRPALQIRFEEEMAQYIAWSQDDRNPNNLAVAELRAGRASRVATLPYVQNWLVQVTSVEPTDGGHGALIVAFGPRPTPILLLTARSDTQDASTVIRRGTAMFNTAVRLSLDQLVRIDGQIVCAMESETRVENRGECPPMLYRNNREALLHPAFYFRFDAIRPAD